MLKLLKAIAEANEKCVVRAHSVAVRNLGDGFLPGDHQQSFGMLGQARTNDFLAASNDMWNADRLTAGPSETPTDLPDDASVISALTVSSGATTYGRGG